MAGEMTVVLGTQKTLESSGSSIANNAVGAASASYDRDSDGASFPDAEFVLAAPFATAPTEGTVVALYARPLDIDGTNDAETPEAARPTVFIGSFVVNNVTGTQYIGELLARDVPRLATYHPYNAGTGQTMGSGWTLKVKPRSYKPAP